MKTIPRFNDQLQRMGSDVIFHHEEPGEECPCRTPEGFRDPTWHRNHLDATVCNEQGYLNPVVTEYIVKAMIQPAISRPRSRGVQLADDTFGSLDRDDKLGIFPCVWNGRTLNFRTSSEAGEDFVVYDGDRYIVVSSDKLPDIDGDPNHHWECGLRLAQGSRPSA
jgi:hypothetical protein